MPEVPENMQQNLAHLEHQAQGQNSYGEAPRRQFETQAYGGQNSSKNNLRSPDGAYYSQQAGILQEYTPNHSSNSGN